MNEEILELKKLLNEALDELYKNDRKLIFRSVNERSITFRFGIYFEKSVSKSNFSHLNVDAEYNKNGDNTKSTPSKPRGAHPDIILHERETNTNNMLVIEFKKCVCLSCGRSHLADFQKLKDFTNQYGRYKYKLGAFISLENEKPKIKFFVDGKLYE